MRAPVSCFLRLPAHRALPHGEQPPNSLQRRRRAAARCGWRQRVRRGGSAAGRGRAHTNTKEIRKGAADKIWGGWRRDGVHGHGKRGVGRRGPKLWQTRGRPEPGRAQPGAARAAQGGTVQRAAGVVWGACGWGARGGTRGCFDLTPGGTPWDQGTTARHAAAGGARWGDEGLLPRGRAAAAAGERGRSGGREPAAWPGVAAAAGGSEQGQEIISDHRDSSLASGLIQVWGQRARRRGPGPPPAAVGTGVALAWRCLAGGGRGGKGTVGERRGGVGLPDPGATALTGSLC